MKYAYPAIFTSEEVEGRGTVYIVEIPDILGCVTEGEGIVEAIDMAREALAGCLMAIKQAKETIPAASSIADLKTNPGQFTSIIDLDLTEYLQRKETKAIVKSVSIPKWLDIMAEDAGVSHSQVLQEALKQKLGISQPTP